MKRILEKLIHISLICCLLFINFYVPEVNAASKTLGDLKNELQKFEKDYADNKLQQELSEKEIKNIQNKINTISSNIVKIGEEIKQLNNLSLTCSIEIAPIILFKEFTFLLFKEFTIELTSVSNFVKQLS